MANERASPKMRECTGWTAVTRAPCSDDRQIAGFDTDEWVLERRPKCLLVAHTMPPLTGGSCVVYDSLARHADGAIVILTSYRDHRTGDEIAGWRDHDQTCGYPIQRIALVRPRLRAWEPSAHRLGRLAREDVPLFGQLCWRVLRLVRRRGVKVVCLGDLDTNGWLIPYARRVASLKTILYTHGDEVSTNAVWRGQMGRRRRYLRAADAIVAVSQYAKNILIERYGVARSKIELIPNGVDTVKFVASSKPAALIDRFGITDKLILLTIARLVERKGVDIALQALPAVRARVPNTHLLVVGEGPFLDQLKRIAAEQGVADAVTFVGAVPHNETPGYYAAGDIFIMPNRRLATGENEGFGLVFLEANACGLPVIAGREGGPSEVVADGVNGLLVDGNNPDAVAQAIVRLATDRALYEQLRAGGLAMAQRQDWSARAQQFLGLCDRLMSA
jgi:phosphatidyl-myo-inositol dimannoside synthase